MHISYSCQLGGFVLVLDCWVSAAERGLGITFMCSGGICAVTLLNAPCKPSVNVEPQVLHLVDV